MSVAVEENPNFRGAGEFLSIGLDLGQTLRHHVHFDASMEHLDDDPQHMVWDKPVQSSTNWDCELLYMAISNNGAWFLS